MAVLTKTLKRAFLKFYLVLAAGYKERGLIQAIGLETWPAGKFTPFFFIQLKKLSTNLGLSTKKKEAKKKFSIIIIICI